MRLLMLYFITLTMTFCTPKKDFSIEIEKRVVLRNVPGGSGLTAYNDTLLLIGDNSPFLFRLDRRYQEIDRMLIFQEFEEQPLLDKQIKPDLECIAIERGDEGNFLYSFGSGSLAPHRNVVLKMAIDGRDYTPEIFNIAQLYNRIRVIAGLEVRDLNIEGAVIFNDKLYLFNRGSNTVIKIDLPEFKLYLKEHISLDSLKMEAFPMALPLVNEKAPGFSGAASIQHTNKILFTATIEDTDNWVDDGEVLGSYVGVLDLEKLPTCKIDAFAQVTQDGQEPLDKLESITVLHEDTNGNILALAVADNDDGSSVLLELKIRGINN